LCATHFVKGHLFRCIESIWDSASSPKATDQRHGGVTNNDEEEEEETFLTNRKMHYGELLLAAYTNEQGSRKLFSIVHAKGKGSDHTVS
jgi:hypothetical protein